jgi:hypothetical protein
MKVVWILTVAYSGLLGLSLYAFSGRRQIAHDSLWRRGARSVAHCYSGCGLGEIVGVTLAMGAFSLGQTWVAVVTFCLAYAFGLALTVGPLLADGERLGDALRDAVVAETASIVVMEAVALAVDLTLSGRAGLGELQFWSSMVVSLSLGLLAAYPVNVLLIHFGIKEGMMNPREMAA